MSHNAARISRQIIAEDLRACLFLRENSLRVSIEAPLLSASFAFVEQLITVTVRGSGWHRLRHHPRPRFSKSHIVVPLMNCKILQLYCIVNAFNVSFYTMANWVIDRKLVNTLMIREKIPNQQELAKHSGVGYHHLSRLFAGNGWDHRTLSRLCTALQCGPQEILLKV